MIRAWLIRPLPLNGVNRVKEFKENGFVAIGWPQTGSLKGKTKEEIRALISQPPYSYAGVILGNYTATIDIFVNQMRVGDLLLMPNGEDIHLGQIIGDYDFDPRVADDATGYPHQRQAEWLTCVSRKDALSLELRLALKNQRTTADLSKFAREIDALSKGERLPTNNASEKASQIPDDVDVMEMSYPLRPNFTLTFKIPKDVTRDEAQRLSRFFATLYFN